MDWCNGRMDELPTIHLIYIIIISFCFLFRTVAKFLDHLTLNPIIEIKQKCNGRFKRGAEHKAGNNVVFL